MLPRVGTITDTDGRMSQCTTRFALSHVKIVYRTRSESYGSILMFSHFGILGFALISLVGNGQHVIVSSYT